MAFMNNNGYNNQNNNGEPKKKTNFRVGRRIAGEDGALTISTWNSDRGGVFTVMSIVQAIGKDPTSGAPVYEQKAPNELPSIYMSTENVCALKLAMEATKDPGAANFTIESGRNAKITVAGTGTGYKITIENAKTGSRTLTVKGVPVLDKTVYPRWKMIRDRLDICYKKCNLAGVDPDEFSVALASSDASDEDTPF